MFYFALKYRFCVLVHLSAKLQLCPGSYIKESWQPLSVEYSVRSFRIAYGRAIDRKITYSLQLLHCPQTPNNWQKPCITTFQKKVGKHYQFELIKLKIPSEFPECFSNSSISKKVCWTEILWEKVLYLCSISGQGEARIHNRGSGNKGNCALPLVQ